MFKPSDVESAYQFYVPSLIDDELLIAEQEKLRIMKAELREQGINVRVAATSPSHPNHDQVLRYLNAITTLGMYEDTRINEAATRTILEEASQGLYTAPDLFTGDRDVLWVRMNYTLPSTDLTIVNSERLGLFIARHPLSRERGDVFAAETALRAGQFLTDQIVELITADTSREIPSTKLEPRSR